MAVASGKPWLVITRDAAAVSLGCAALALAVNAARPGGIPLVQREDYPILVPCPESVAEVDTITPADARVRAPGTLLVDARAQPEAPPPAGVMSVPYDYLEPTPPEVIAKIAASGAHTVVVFGDGEDPDSGHELARELAAKGIRNVLHLGGGAPALLRETAEVSP